MSAQLACPECKVIGGDHKADCTRPALLADLTQAKLAARAANDCNRTWQDVSDDFVFANGQGEPSRIPAEALQDYLRRFPQFHDRLVQLYQDWNAEPMITDEMLDAIEHGDDAPAVKASAERSWIAAQRILKFYDKVRRIEAERKALVVTLARLYDAAQRGDFDNVGVDRSEEAQAAVALLETYGATFDQYSRRAGAIDKHGNATEPDPLLAKRREAKS